ncbi:MAG: desulfoferrodoxin [Fusobacteriota bacterium]
MAKKLGIYKCDICGNIVEVFHEGQGDLVCCGEPMVLKEEQTAESSKEKHVPFIEEIDGGYKVKIGENNTHPMTEEHYIEWIELIADNKIYRKELNPGDAPEAEFKIKASKVTAREYCNVHGNWSNEK